jgi:membrane fusion protein, multidrug efflux system
MRTFIFIAAALVALQACQGKAGQQPAIKDEAIPVRIASIDADTAHHTIHASGLLGTENEARLSFKIGGIVESIQVKEGDFVKKGQLLATLVPTEITAQVRQVQLSLEKAERDYQRMQNLYKDSVATLEQLQNTKTGVDIARQNLQQVSFNQQYSRIYAPADGFVVKKIANAGEQVSAGNPVVITSAVSSSSKWILKAGLADKEWAAVETGNAAVVSIDAFPGKTFPARISKKSLAADPLSGSFSIELQVDPGTAQPAVGMFGTAVITPSSATTGYSIPYEALLDANGQKGFVFVSNDRKSVQKVEVSIASISNNRVYVNSGLEGHAFVITSGSPYLSEKSTIKIVQ